VQSDLNTQVLIELIVTALRSHPELHLAFEQGLIELELGLLSTFRGQRGLFVLCLWRAKVGVCQLVAPGWGVSIFSSATAMLVDSHWVVAGHGLVISLWSTRKCNCLKAANELLMRWREVIAFY
jgi:hypothetical protein